MLDCIIFKEHKLLYHMYYIRDLSIFNPPGVPTHIGGGVIEGRILYPKNPIFRICLPK